MNLEFSAGGLIYRQGKQGKIELALILDPYGKWTMPKGHIELGEKPQVASLREIQEEIGLNHLQLAANLGKMDYWFKDEGKNLIHKYVYYYLFKAKEGMPLKPNTAEIKDAKWFDAKGLKKLSTYKDTKPIIEKALNILNQQNNSLH
jgi:ADP-ribose pyrophosphatase YjhB (NUDIX family)